MKRILGLTLLTLTAALAAAGCSPSTAPESGGSTEAPTGTPTASAPAEPAGKPTEAAVEELEAKLKASPDNAALKESVAKANYELGHSMMLDPDLPPRVKYRGALKYFRRTLELDPKHAEAAQEKKTIEDIYTQMGRPIPQ